MSFAEEVRGELMALPVRKPCCRRSAAAGLLLDATFAEGHELCVRFKHPAVADYAKTCLSGQFGNHISFVESGRCGHRYFDCSLTSGAAVKCLQNLLEGGEVPKCEGCRAALLRSAFLAFGTITDPHKAFHLEFSISEAGADAVSSILSELGYPPKRVCRDGRVGLYYKDGASIEDLLSAMGSHHAIFELMNTRIEREIRNNENRATNCVARNIERYVSAVEKQVEAIDYLMATGRMEDLPKPLQITAKLRYDNPEATLAELAALHTPAVSRSGVNHRLERLLEEAEKYRKGKRL